MKTLGRFIRQVILESNYGLSSSNLPSGVRAGRDIAAAIRTFEVVQSHVKGAKTLGEFLDNLPVGSKVWQWSENVVQKDGVFVVKNINLTRRPRDLLMILEKQEDGTWVSPVYFTMPQGSEGVFVLKMLIKSFVKPDRIAKFDQAVRFMEFPIQMSAADLEPDWVGSIVVAPAKELPNWVTDMRTNTLMLMKSVNVPRFIESIKSNPTLRGAAANMMYGVSIPDLFLGSDGIVPVNMAALKQYDEQGAVTIEVHQGESVFEADLIKDPNTGRPVAYPKIPL